MPSTPSSSPARRRPTVDEWGVYDPQQAGLAALYTRLIDRPADARPGEHVSAGPAGPIIHQEPTLLVRPR